MAEIRHYETLHLASRAIARDINRKIRNVLSRKNEFNLAISGGNTPIHLYDLLESEYKIAYLGNAFISFGVMNVLYQKIIQIITTKWCIII